MRLLIDQLKLKFPRNFSLSEGEQYRIGVAVDRMTKSGKLSKWTTKEWLTYTIIQKVVSSWFETALSKGVQSWDIVLFKALSMVFMSALGCRAGDIILSGGYPEEYMVWKHIVIKVNGTPSVKQLTMTVVIASEKGAK